MGRITSGIGLNSGMDISSIVDQLMKLESRPLEILQDRQASLDAQRTAVLDVSAIMMSARLSITGIRSSRLLQSTSATSSNASILNATASSGASPGTYSFRVGRLVSAQQQMSSGFTSTTSPVFTAGTMTIQSAQARLVDDTRLDVLNGQQGVRLGRIRIADRSGASAVVDLTTAVTMNDILEAINNADAVNVRASTEGGRLVIDDLSGGAGLISIGEVSGGNTAADLGILSSTAGSRLTGENLVSVNSETPLSILNHGIGVQRNPSGDDLDITLRDGTAFSVNLSGASTLGDVIEAINAAGEASDNPGALTAAINAAGTGLTLTDSSGGPGQLTVASVAGSRAAVDLGIGGSSDTGAIEGTALLADLQGVLLSRLNGGSGVSRGVISITDRNGVTSEVDLTSANTVQDVIAAINDASVSAEVTASLNSTGNSLVITDTSGGSAGPLIIADTGGTTTAADLGIAGSVEASVIKSGDLGRQFVSLDTRLDSLNGGSGINLGRFSITNSLGATASINLTSGTYTTLRDVVDRINANGINVNARLNDSGDGIVLEDNAGGSSLLSVSDDAGSSARDLGISGTAATGETFIDGTSRITIEVDETDTLETLRTKMGASGAGLIVNLLNDGSGVRPHRLSVVSTRSGEAGALLIDGSEIGLEMTEVMRGRDAVLSVGDGASSPLVITSRTNSFKDVIAGVTLDAQAADASQTVTVNVARDTAAATKAVKTMVEGLNSVLSKIATFTKYDAEAQQGAVLQGNSAMIRAQQRIFSAVLASFEDTGSAYRNLSAVGLKIKDGQLELDEAAFSAALESNASDVEALFMDTEHGVVKKLGDLMTSLSSTGSGTLSVQATQFESQSEMIQDRIESMNVLLEMKRERLTMQFINMERALGQIQIQQSALTSLQQLASNFNMRTDS